MVSLSSLRSESDRTWQLLMKRIFVDLFCDLHMRGKLRPNCTKMEVIYYFSSKRVRAMIKISF